MDPINVNRRDFLKGFAAVGGAAALVSVTGCGTKADSAKSDSKGATEEKITPASTVDCDICIVGAGVSGLSAAVQAGELGANVVALELSDAAGGGGRMGVEGSFGYGSTMFKESGLQVSRLDMLKSEMDMSQNRANAQLWNDFFDVAGENIDWLVKNGVEFRGDIDEYHGGKHKVFHWYKNGRCAEGYVPQMTKKAEELGVQFMYKTPAKRLITDDKGAVTGVYAKGPDDKWIQVNAKAVILASGGYGANPEIVSRIGYDKDRVGCMFDFAQGDGLNMATAIGGRDAVQESAEQIAPMIEALPKGQSNLVLCIDPSIPWVNDEGDRFYNEDIVNLNMSYSNPPKKNQKDYFMLFDQSTLDNFTSWGVDGVDIPAEIAKVVKTENGSLYSADSWEELASKFGVDPAALKKTVDRYNQMCRDGKDEDYGKDAKFLKELSKPPYYMARPMWVAFCVVGALGTNRHAQVVKDNHEPIPGLYAIGNDGCMLYRNIYTIETPGTCSGYGIASGRTSVKHAYENYVK